MKRSSIGILLGIWIFGAVATAQSLETDPSPSPAAGAPPAAAPAPDRVSVRPKVKDVSIRQRLDRILHTTGWFLDIGVESKDGVVFLAGETKDPAHREWAENLAASTEGVVAVVNRIGVQAAPMWDFTPAYLELRGMLQQAVQASPLFLLALALLFASWATARTATHLGNATVLRRVRHQLLRHILSRTIGVITFLFGLYLVLRVAGLTDVATTVVGGTGLVGLVLGFAFRDIAENWLTSILLSVQRPFESGDLVEVAGLKGYVQQMDTHSTILLTLDGQQVRVPNSKIYKDVIRNFGANPRQRCDFSLSIEGDRPVQRAQSAAFEAVAAHPSILRDPAPQVLVDSLEGGRITLRVYFWIDQRRDSEPRVRSALLREVRHRFQADGLLAPDRDGDHGSSRTSSNAAEGHAGSEAAAVEEQARNTRAPASGTDLLGGT